MTPTVLTIETETVRASRGDARIKFYTDERRMEFGEFLYRTAVRIIAQQNNDKRRKRNEQDECNGKRGASGVPDRQRGADDLYHGGHCRRDRGIK